MLVSPNRYVIDIIEISLGIKVDIWARRPQFPTPFTTREQGLECIEKMGLSLVRQVVKADDEAIG